MSRRMNRRTFVKHAAVAAGALGVAGSAVGGRWTAAAQSGTATGEITVTSIPGAAGDRVQLVANNFMAANPNAKINVNIAGGAETEYKPQFPQIVNSSDKPDLAWYWVDGRQYQDIANAGLLESLDDMYASEGWNEVLSESTKNVYTSPDGQKYAVCESIVWYPQIYYNREAFAKAGVEEPASHYFASLDEFYAACDKLRAAGYEPLTMGGGEGWIIGHTHDALLQRVATDEQLTDLIFNWRPGSEPKVGFTDGPWAQSTQLLLDMYQKNVWAEGFLGRSYAEGRALFVQGKAAMYQDGSWAPTAAILYKEAPELDFGWMIYPQVDPNIKPEFLLYAGGGMMIPKGGKNPELARQFLAYLMSKEQMTAAAEAAIVVPSRSDIPVEVIQKVGPQVAEMYPLLTEYGTATGWDDPVPADMAERSLILWQELLTGQTTAEQIGQEIERLADRHRSR